MDGCACYEIFIWAIFGAIDWPSVKAKWNHGTSHRLCSNSAIMFIDAKRLI